MTDLSLKRQSQKLVNLTTFYDTNFNFPIIYDIQQSEIINQTVLNDNRIINLQGGKDGGNDRSKVLDDLLNYTLEIQRSNNSEKYGGWQGRIERVIEKHMEVTQQS